MPVNNSAWHGQTHMSQHACYLMQCQASYSFKTRKKHSIIFIMKLTTGLERSTEFMKWELLKMSFEEKKALCFGDKAFLSIKGNVESENGDVGDNCVRYS